MQARSVGSPTPRAPKQQEGETAKGTNSFESINGIVRPELVISTSERDLWYQRNPHARPGVLEGLVARGVLVIVPDGLMSTAVPDMRTALPVQGVRA